MICGVALHSVVYFHDKLKSMVGNSKSIMLFDPNKSKKSDILLIPNFNILKKNLRNIKHNCKVCVVFDSPLYLSEIKNIKMLDVKYDKKLSYKFHLSEIDWEKLILDIEKSEKEYEIKKLKLKNLEIIPQMIKKNQSGKFLDKYNGYIYNITNHKTRTTTSKIIINYLFGEYDKNEYDKKMSRKKPKRGLGKDLYQELEDFFNSKYGRRLRNALIESKKKVSTKTLSKKYKIDSYELKYLGAAYRTLNNINTETRNIKDIAEKAKNNLKTVKENEKEEPLII